MVMFSLKNSCLILLAVIVLSCKKNDNTVKSFYNLDSLIKAQVIYLAEKKPVLFKEALMDHKSDTAFLKNLDTTAWYKELEVFRQLDLNRKTFNMESYSTVQGMQDPYSNLLICEYKAKDKLAIRNVKIYYDGNLNNPKKIEGEYYDHNGLYANARNMVMELNTVRSTAVLTRYTITGGQKMILGDTVEFKITGTVIH